MVAMVAARVEVLRVGRDEFCKVDRGMPREHLRETTGQSLEEGSHTFCTIHNARAQAKIIVSGAPAQPMTVPGLVWSSGSTIFSIIGSRTSCGRWLQRRYRAGLTSSG